jgi:hypothetical protein
MSDVVDTPLLLRTPTSQSPFTDSITSRLDQHPSKSPLVSRVDVMSRPTSQLQVANSFFSVDPDVLQMCEMIPPRKVITTVGFRSSFVNVHVPLPGGRASRFDIQQSLQSIGLPDKISSALAKKLDANRKVLFGDEVLNSHFVDSEIFLRGQLKVNPALILSRSKSINATPTKANAEPVQATAVSSQAEIFSQSLTQEYPEIQKAQLDTNSWKPKQMQVFGDANRYLFVGDAGTYGKGVFAKEDIPQSTVVALYLGRVVDNLTNTNPKKVPKRTHTIHLPNSSFVSFISFALLSCLFSFFFTTNL